MTEQDSAAAAGVFAQNYSVELLYEAPPGINKGHLLDVLQKRCPDIAPLDGKRDSDLLAFAHREHTTKQGSTNVPAQAFLLAFNKGPDMASIRASLEQSWSWPQAVEAIPRCKATVVLSDVQAARLPPAERLVLFECVLASILDAYPCRAIHWRPTQQFVNPQAFLDAMAEAGGLVHTPGPVNVRLFRVEKEVDAAGSQDQEYFMDTLGLTPLGLPDIQCHFRNLDPQAVSRVLYNTAIYLLEHGPVLKEDDTVPGVGPDDRWTCYPTRSISLPERRVIDLDPGPPHSCAQQA